MQERPVAYNACVPWTSSSFQQITPRAGGTLYCYRDPAGGQWWRDGHALSRGFVPGSLRHGYRAAGLPVRGLMGIIDGRDLASKRWRLE